MPPCTFMPGPQPRQPVIHAMLRSDSCCGSCCVPIRPKGSNRHEGCHPERSAAESKDLRLALVVPVRGPDSIANSKLLGEWISTCSSNCALKITPSSITPSPS
jgi:hypothetical protein